MSIGLYDSSLNGPQMDTALEDMANHTSERYAKGTVNGVPVSSGMGYHDNAKYYADQAASVIPGEYTDAVRFDIDQTNIKSAAEKAQARANIACGSSNRNLLDNGWFTINQRGQSSYSTDTYTYTVDRWAIQSGSLSINNGYISVSAGAYLMQGIEQHNSLLGKTVTLSILRTDNSINSATFEYGATSGRIGEYHYYVTNILYVSPCIALTSSSSALEVKAAKLELGSVSTLANDVAPNYAEELAKSQRYFIKFGSCGFAGYNFNSQLAVFYIPLPISMRALPTITVASVNVRSGGVYHISTNVGVLNADGSILRCQAVVDAGLTQDEGNCVQVDSGLQLSADL